MLLNKKLSLLIAFICLFLSIVTLQDTYAKYTSSVSSSANISIARWKILVNNFDIKNELTKSAFLKALTIFDKQTDKDLIKKELVLERELNINSFYSFKLFAKSRNCYLLPNTSSRIFFVSFP